MIYICEKCGMVYDADYDPTESKSCGCTYIRRADEREVLEIVGIILLNGDDMMLKEDRKRSKTSQMKTIKRILLFSLVVLVVAVGVQVKGGYDKYKDALENKPLDEVIAELQSKANYVQYDEVPEIYFKALVAVEDRRFYNHNGFDIIGTGRAIYNDIKAKKLLEGGSTISQQLAKNLYFPKDDTLERKIAEVFMALKIERDYTKEEILEFYVNGIYYCSGYYSIYDASMGYFEKEPKDMTDYECTLLVGIPNAPSIYSLDVRPDLAKQRQERVVECMVDVGYITEDEGNNIILESSK